MELRPWPEDRLNDRWVNLVVVCMEMDGKSKALGIPSARVSTPCFPGLCQSTPDRGTFLLSPLRLEEEIDSTNHPLNQPDGVLRMGRELL